MLNLSRCINDNHLNLRGSVCKFVKTQMQREFCPKLSNKAYLFIKKVMLTRETNLNRIKTAFTRTVNFC